MSKFSLPHKLKLAQLPTQIQYSKFLSELASEINPINVWIKRDDLTHGAAAGNKIRKLEYLFAYAIEKKMKTVITCGAIQSNHARATAILAKELGLNCVLFLRKPNFDEPEVEGNYFLDLLAGAEIRFVTNDQYENINHEFLKAQEFYRKTEGVVPLIIPEGGSNALGALGYVTAIEEIISQCGKAQLPNHFDSIVLANGSGGTHAGLLLGRSLYDLDSHTEIISFNISRTAEILSKKVQDIALSCIQQNKLPISFMPSDIHVIDGYVGLGYAKVETEIYDFIAEIAAKDGIFLDPVYAAKAAWGMIQEIKKNNENTIRLGKNILFILTGGLPSFFAHRIQLEEAMIKFKKIPKNFEDV